VYWHAFQGCRTTLIGTDFEEGAGHVFLGKKSPYSPYGPAQKIEGRTVINSGHIFQGIGTFFKAFVLLGFPYSLGRILARNLRTVRTTFIAGTAVQCTDFWFRNREAKGSLLSKKTEISFV
jgi:hypothetical protein